MPEIKINSHYNIWEPIDLDMEEFDDVMWLRRVLKSESMASVLFEITANMRKKVRWHLEAKDMENNPLDSYDAVEYVFEQIREQLELHNIDIDELIY